MFEIIKYKIIFLLAKLFGKKYKGVDVSKNGTTTIEGRFYKDTLYVIKYKQNKM